MDAVLAIGIVVAIFVVARYVTGDGLDLGGFLGGKLSAAEILVYASNAGFRDDDLATAVAIALAESGGDPQVIGDQSITPGGSVGLWQINLRWHPELANQDLTNPQVNAAAAFSVYQGAGQSFRPWSTFNTGAYLRYLDTSIMEAEA